MGGNGEYIQYLQFIYIFTIIYIQKFVLIAERRTVRSDRHSLGGTIPQRRFAFRAAIGSVPCGPVRLTAVGRWDRPSRWRAVSHWTCSAGQLLKLSVGNSAIFGEWRL